MGSLVDKLARRFESWLLPSLCVLCGGRGARPNFDLCEGCQGDLVRNVPACERCAQPLAGPYSAALCGRCLRKMPQFDLALSPFRYVYPLDHVVRALKYSGKQVYGRVLGDLLAEQLASRDALHPQLLIPVPLGSRRFHERGFNQAIEIGVRLEKALRIPLAADRVVRTRNTAEQAALNRKQRRRNVRGAFEVVRALRAKHVAIVDDVITTGSTVDELARTLRRAGVERIEVWAVARTPLPSRERSTKPGEGSR